MGLEKTVIDLAKESNIQGAYFYEGTLFVPCDASTDEAFLNFEAALDDAFPFVNIQYNSVGDEVAIDFAGPKNVEEIYSPYLGAV
jgi:hypothetical protein